MANEEQLSILKQGVEVWNRWRLRNLSIEVDLIGADLRGENLGEANLSAVNLTRADISLANLTGTDLRVANLSGARLRGANLVGADLGRADLRGADLAGAISCTANLSEADLSQVNFVGADLSQANLNRTNLTEANFNITTFREANLTSAILIRANFNRTYFQRSIFSDATIDGAIFGYSDLSSTIGMEEIIHHGPSSVSSDTLALSKGQISEVFLRGCGLSDWEIEVAKLYNPDLSNEEINNIQYKIYDLRATQALQISPLFISYSHADGTFIDRIGNSLTEEGIRYWRDIHDMKAGRMETQIDRAIRQNPTVLLVLSEHSLSSDWVEHEVRTARELEKEMGRDVLCPVALDDSWKESRWPKRVIEQIMEYNILDFSAWEDDSKFDGMFRKLIDGLELFYKG